MTKSLLVFIIATHVSLVLADYSCTVQENSDHTLGIYCRCNGTDLSRSSVGEYSGAVVDAMFTECVINEGSLPLFADLVYLQKAEFTDCPGMREFTQKVVEETQIIDELIVTQVDHEESWGDFRVTETAMNKLLVLKLTNLGLTSFEDTDRIMTDLLWLDLSYNNFSGSMPDLSSYSRMEEFVCRYCEISGTLQTMLLPTDLKFLFLPYNKITNVTEYGQDMHKRGNHVIRSSRMTWLDLSNNLISDVSHDSFVHMHTKTSPGSGFTNRIIIDFHNNSLIEFSDRLITDLVNNKDSSGKVILNMNDNPLRCTCAPFRAVTLALSENEESLMLWGECAAPEKLQGADVSALIDIGAWTANNGICPATTATPVVHHQSSISVFSAIVEVICGLAILTVVGFVAWIIAKRYQRPSLDEPIQDLNYRHLRDIQMTSPESFTIGDPDDNL